MAQGELDAVTWFPGLSSAGLTQRREPVVPPSSKCDSSWDRLHRAVIREDAGNEQDVIHCTFGVKSSPSLCMAMVCRHLREQEAVCSPDVEL